MQEELTEIKELLLEIIKQQRHFAKVEVDLLEDIKIDLKKLLEK